MTDTLDDDLDIDDPRDEAGLTPAERRTLQKRAKQADELEQRALEAERRAAIAEAGIKLNDRQRKALFATHDGELTAEAIRETAEELGFVTAAPDTPKEELDQHGRLTEAMQGGQPHGDRDWDAELRNAGSEQEFDRIYAESGKPMAGSQ